MKNLTITKSSNPFNPQYSLNIKTDKTEIKEYKEYNIDRISTKEMIRENKAVYGIKNVTVSEVYKNWCNEEVVDVTVKMPVFDSVVQASSFDLLKFKASKKGFKI